MHDGFYRYIVGNKKGYKIQKGNECYGTYKKLSDALYERDRLIASDWNWDDALQLEETENFYERMNLPPFIHTYSYIRRVVQTYKIYDGDEYVCSFNAKSDAYNYAKLMGYSVIEANIVYRIFKTIEGKLKYFGTFKKLEDAITKRDKLIKNGWKDEFIE